ncbi:MAG: tetratricopeptide repeat protein [Gammaproteobacteria bacterium]|nr:tetratricopeptide repeat protein [Gammaproteobacteria bacterium]
MSETNPTYAATLHAACQNLPAHKSDLERLLGPIHAMQVSQLQVSGLLKQAWLRLEALRESHADVSGPASEHPDIARLLERAFAWLQPDETFSLDDANAAFEQAYRGCLEIGAAADLVAAICAGQAQIAAVKLDYRQAASLYAEAATTAGLSVPLQWRYQTQHALVLADLGRELIDDAALEEAIDLYETRVLALAPRVQRPDDWAATQHHLGDALGALGQRQRGTWMLEKAIETLECALSERSRGRVPLDWAATQNSLGNTLGILAQRHADTEMLEKSAAAFQSALEERTRDRSPHDWAVTQNNLGAALLALGQRKKDKTVLKQASEAYKNVLQVWTRERMPLEWAVTMNNLGTALRMLGEHRKGPRTLQQAVAACRSALAEGTRARVPKVWALTQNNLGAALHKLGEREQDAQALEAAVESYESALEEWTRERAPMSWAMTMANLCAARKALAEQLRDVELVRRVLTDFGAVAEVFREASHARYYELVVEQVALTRKLERELLSNETLGVTFSDEGSV